MPNHVTNIVKTKNPQITALLNDFKKIIPMPKIFDGFSNAIPVFFGIDEFIESVKEKNLTDINKDILKKIAVELQDEIDDEFILQAYCYFKTGYKDPIDWSRKNWGTKWNSYDFELTDDGCKFDTAWTHPSPIIWKLSEMFPDDEIEILYADEDIGNNLGHYKIKNGKCTIIVDEEKMSAKENQWFTLGVKGCQDEYIWDEQKGCYTPKDDFQFC